MPTSKDEWILFAGVAFILATIILTITAIFCGVTQ